MKVSPEEYRRGIVWWGHPDAEIHVASTESLEEPVVWSEGVVAHSGAIAPVLAGRSRRVRVLSNRDDRPIPSGWRVRWECSVGTHINTMIWKDAHVHPTLLAFVPNFGTFHRLVVHTPLLTGTEEFALRAGDVVVRLVEGSLRGELVGTIDPATISAWEVPRLNDAMGDVVVRGRFVEIVAPGATGEDAELAAFAVLGYLAACLGECVVGEIVFTERYHVTENRVEIAHRVRTLGVTPRPATDETVTALDQGFAAAANAVAAGGSVALALRWYEQGIRFDAPLDKLIAFFIGVESMVNAFAADHGPLKVVTDRRRKRDEVMTALRGKIDGATLRQVSHLLRDPAPSLLDAYTFYAAERKLAPALLGTFKMARDLRNRAVHGEVVHVEAQQAANARRLLGRILRTELGVSQLLPREPEPRVLGAELRYSLAAPPPPESDAVDASADEQVGG